jgi:signal transduction protein with GAF and PtsI domain
VDRADPRLSTLYEPLHPAVLRAIRAIVVAAEAASIPLSLCGEMAAEPLDALLLMGLGVRELSMNPASIPKVKEGLRRTPYARAREIALTCLRLPTARAIEAEARRGLADALAAAEKVTPDGLNEG